MKIRLLKCWLVLLSLALAFGWGQKNVANAQCLAFNGAATNVLTSFIDVYPNYPNSAATFDVLVQTTNQPLPVGTYLTWCVDQATELDPSQNYTVPGTIYTGALFATCDTNLNNELPTNHPASCYVSPAVWNEVNYILNHKNNAYFWDIQYAINDLVGGPFIDNTSAFPPFDINVVQSLVNAAVTNAATWSPQPGNVIGAIYVITNQAGVTLTNPVQLVMLEVPYCPITFTATPTNITLGCNPATIPTGNVANVTAVSSCGYPVNVTFTTSQATVGCTSYRYITYTAADGYGNSASYTQTIKWTVDTTAPILTTVPASTNLGYNPAVLPTDISISNQVSYTETCSAPVISVSHVDSGTPCAMLRTFSISATDACGNVSPTTKVVYQYAIDTNAPVVTTVPPSTNYGCTTVTLPTAATVLSQVTATDNCIVVSTNISSVDTTNGSTVTRTFTITATDGAGNVSTPKTVTYSYTINNGPTIQCAADITITGTNTSPSVTGVPILMDACGNSITCTNSATTLVTNYYNLYCDQFTNANCALNGRGPDTVNAIGGQWIASSGWKCGTQAAATNCSGNAFLPFSPQGGVLYQVSADIECLSGPGTTPTSDWVAIGFCNGTDTADWWQSVNNPVGWQLARNTGNTTYCGQSFIGPGVANGYNNGFFPTNLTHYSVILDTRPSSPAAWTFTCLANGQVVTPTTACGGNGPAISSVGFGVFSYPCSGAAAHVKNFCASFGITSVVTNTTSCSNLSYVDMVVPGACAGQVHIVRTWYGWDNSGHTNTCTQNIYETIPLRAVTFASTTTNLGCSPTSLPTASTVASLVIGYSGLSSTNITSVDTTNGCNVTRTFTVIVKDSCGDVSPAATLAYTWVNASPAISCWVSGPASGICLSPATYTCWITNTGNAPFASCTLTACGQSFTCPALQPGQSCSIPCTHTFQLSELGTFNCQAVVSAVCATACAPTCSAQSICPTKVCGQPSCTVTCSGPTSGLCLSPCTYNCTVVNNGTCPFASCILTACGQSFTCPALQPGQSCVIPVTHTFQLAELGTFLCQPVCNATCVNSTAPTCSAQTLCSTTVLGQPSCQVTCSGPTSGLCLSPSTYNCTVVNNGTCPFSACTLTACGQSFTCPALQPGQSCVIPVSHTFQTCDLGTFLCQPVCNATCVNSTAPTCSAQTACSTTVVGQPSCKVTCSGPTSGFCFSPCTYTCTVVNNGTCPFSACTLTACGQNISCPALQPGQSCTIPVSHTFQLSDLGSFNCQPVCNAKCSYSTVPTCSAQTSCSTWVAWAL